MLLGSLHRLPPRHVSPAEVAEGSVPGKGQCRLALVPAPRALITLRREESVGRVCPWNWPRTEAERALLPGSECLLGGCLSLKANGFITEHIALSLGEPL